MLFSNTRRNFQRGVTITKKTPLATTGSLNWSHNDRQLLCVLSRYLKTPGTTDDRSQLAQESHRILQWIFSHRDDRSDITPERTAGGVRGMLIELHKRMDPAWKDVFIESSFRNPSRWENEIQQLKAAARSLGLSLVMRQSEHPNTRSQIHKAEASRNRQMNPSQGQEVDSSQIRGHISKDNDTSAAPMSYETSGVTDERHATRVSTSKEQEEFEYLMMLENFPKNTDWDSYSYRHLFNRSRRLVFRVWTPSSHSINTKEGCYAGRWTGTGVLLFPRSSIEYCLSAYRHLRGEVVSSPFLSVTTSFSWALRMLLRDENAVLIIIDMDALFAQAASPSCITPVVPLLKTMPPFKASLAYLRAGDSDETRPNSRGSRWLQMSEWLVWSEIPGSCITNAISHSEMKNFLRTNPEVDRRLLLTRLGGSNNGRDATELLTNAKLKPTGVWAEAVGKLMGFLGLDFAHAYRLGKLVKYHWIDKHREAKSRRVKRTAKSRLVNLAFQGGLAEGFWKTITSNSMEQITEAEPDITAMDEIIDVGETEMDDDDTSSSIFDDHDEPEPESPGINIVDLTGIESDTEDDEMIVIGSNALRHSIPRGINLGLQVDEDDDMGLDEWAFVDDDNVNSQSSKTGEEGNNSFDAGCHRIEQMFV